MEVNENTMVLVHFYVIWYLMSDYYNRTKSKHLLSVCSSTDL